MSAPVAVKRYAQLGLKVAGALAFLAPLLTRLVVGIGFHETGRGKLQNLENVVGFFSGLGIPFPELNAAFVSRLEYYGGALLILGLFTRLVSGLLASTMVVALMTADRADFLAALGGSFDDGLMGVTPVPFLLALVWLIFYGPGRVALDALLAKWIRSDAQPEPAPAQKAAA